MCTTHIKNIADTYGVSLTQQLLLEEIKQADKQCEIVITLKALVWMRLILDF